VRKIEIVSPSWSVDDEGKVTGDKAERLETTDHIKALDNSYSYARA
jgi:hypothetical protein